MDNHEMSNGAVIMIQLTIILTIGVMLVILGMIIGCTITNDYSSALRIVGIEEDNSVLSVLWSR